MDQTLPILDDTRVRDPVVDSSEASRKLEVLLERLRPLVRKGALIAFSGGMDSAFLLWAATEAGREVEGRVVALTTTSPSTPTRDQEDARAFSHLLGAEHVWVEGQETELDAYVRNDRERCYHCKAELFRVAGAVASREGLEFLLDGYNASDLSDDRPGHRAAKEVGVLSPLADSGLTKPEIGFLLEKAGLPLGNKAASPCLSSRIMTGLEITPQRLEDVEDLEGILRREGAVTVRVRICRSDDGVPFIRVEVDPGEMDAVLANREELLREGTRRGYRWVTMDLAGYRMGGGVR